MGSLAQVLRDMAAVTDPNLLVSPESFDDAGVYRINDSQALVQTVDFFPPLVDDPLDFGRVAAANSLSDVYAMGARPLCCLNIFAFPDQELPMEVAEEILRGGSEKVAESGAVIVGGHSVRDAEVKYGLAVTGIAHPERIITNAGALPGDRLVLTKPIGSGTLTTAAKKGKISAEILQQCIQVMSDLNRAACEVMLEVGVHAATDITGFGLIGHAHEVAAASGVTLTIDAGSVPLMDEVLALGQKDMFTRAVRSNWEYVGARFDVQGVNDVLVKILLDAQTSGGLLISVPQQRADGLVSGLKDRGTCSADLIGEVTEPSDYTIILKDKD